MTTQPWHKSPLRVGGHSNGEPLVVVDPFATHCAGHAHMLYAKLANDRDTLANLVACLPHVGQSPDLVERYEAQLTSVAPQHGWVANVTAAATSFDRAVEIMES